MKTISVKQVAEALSLTPRAVIYRLEKGQLKGTQQANAFGKQEWRVYPTKEIAEGLKRLQQPSDNKGAQDDAAFNFSPEEAEVVDAITGEDAGIHDEQQDGKQAWNELAKDTLRSLAEELVRPLADTIREQQALLAEKEKTIADKDQQLKLLPDYQKQAEDERKAAELRALEAEALKKQIEAIQAQQEEELTAKRRVEELEKAMEQLRAEDVAKLDQLKEKAEEAALSAARLEQLEKEIQQLKKPKPSIWQRLFMPAGGQES